MPIRITAVPQDNATGEMTDPLGYDATYDNMTFHFGPGQRRNFPDAGVGLGFAADDSVPAAAIIQDNTSSGKKNAETFNSRT